jgi:DNA-binding PadR family transcriptional regulator
MHWQREQLLGGRSAWGHGNGPGMRAGKMLASGDLQLIILLLLSEKSRYGYEIIKSLEEHSCGIYVPSPGMVYPALTYLEEVGYAAAAANGAKKLYTITAEGADHLAKRQDTTNAVWTRLAIFGRKVAEFQKQFAEEEDVEDHFGSGPRGQSRDEWKQMKTEFREVRNELKAAIYEKLDSSLEEKRKILRILKEAIAEIRGKV